MTKNYILECCADTLEAVRSAVSGGANRIELCGSLIIGGVTPSPFLCEMVLSEIKVPIRVMIRPRFGDFLYSESEFEIMRREVSMFRRMGCEGVVFGILTADGRLDKKRMSILREEAGDMKAALHRAFDVAVEPFEALEAAREIGMDTILTSGRRQKCIDGKALLRQLAERGGGIEILAGGSVDEHTIRELGPCGIKSFHLSGRIAADSPMLYKNPDVNMGFAAAGEYQRWICSAEKIAAARAAMEELS